ncbi:hypothetical protein EJ05DRAFT_290903 [Pseudovirgaria hyperparasitica]|uniref:Maintenance of telomere capping protein 6 n=1 Tax=Pseudovirgaria hyperparasitica TaxID=470096 RepID=A0A6A6WCR4_9PEZI|nr:uncharacterized protein EJ05DRAFT_290903 [Pseudovirgaria hyperparasitica]KAF2760618.1 hypothetical protein EJ05DRAFT_290903 [Pseudovirgaria hyperparasitica]
MSGSYQPSPDAETQPPWTTAFLSQRDVAFELPIDFITKPGVSLTAACFASNRFEDDAIKLCVSNLLAMGFKRLVVDLYWDAGRAVWSLCPAEVPESASTGDDTSIASAPSSRSTAFIASGVLSDDQTGSPPAPTEAGAAKVMARQDSSAGLSGSNSPSEISSPVSSTTTTIVTSPSPMATYVSSSNGNDETLLQIGPYSCTATSSLSLLADILYGYFQASETTVVVDLTILELNIHAAASSSNPSSPAASPADSQLPQGTQLLSGALNANLSANIYTPTMLDIDRANLNQSWFEIPGPDAPIIPYLTLEKDGNTYSTPSGWPTETFTNFDRYSRMIAYIGRVDPQMSNYNFSGDADTIFMSGTMEAVRNVTLSTDGAIRSGCFFDRTVPAITEATNNSWAVTSNLNIPASGTLSDSTFSTLSNLSSCGISSLLNQTLAGQSADTDPATYRAFANAATIWSWAPDQPNTTDPASKDDTNNSINFDDNNDDTTGQQGLLCAALYPSLNGRWKATNCQSHHHAACRIASQPYAWTLSPSPGPFTDFASPSRCPPNSSFSAPRSALENTWLLSLLIADTDEDHHTTRNASDPIFINFQAIDRPDCWVVGVNTTCPYLEDPNEIRTRTVVVPAVAAVVIFAVAALMFFIKCASNRRNARRGRRRRGSVGGADRGDYEGVPS